MTDHLVRTAIHEAAHAVIAKSLGFAVHHVQIGKESFCMTGVGALSDIPTKRQRTRAFNDAVVLVSGQMAVETLLKVPGDYSDVSDRFEMHKMAVRLYPDDDDAAIRWLQRVNLKAFESILIFEDFIRDVATALMSRKALDWDELHDVTSATVLRLDLEVAA